MGPLEIVIVSLVVLLLFSIGRLAGIAQLLRKILMNVYRSFLKGLFEEEEKTPRAGKRHKGT